VEAARALALGARMGSSLLLSALLLTPACAKSRRSPTSSDGPAPDGGPSASRTAPEPTVAERDGQTARIDVHLDLPWAEGCMIRRPCSPLPKLERCAPGLTPVESTTLDSTPPGALGEPLAVRGPITLTPIWKTLAGCPRQPDARGCCNSAGAEAMIGRFPHAIVLDGLGCGGDDSRLCCSLPVFGQTVVAVGRLAKDSRFAREGAHWALGGATLCEEDGAGAARAPGCQLRQGP